MSNREFKKGRKLPTEESTKNHQNFDQVLKQSAGPGSLPGGEAGIKLATKGTLYWIGGIIIAGAIAVTSLFSNKDKTVEDQLAEQKTNEAIITENTPFIEPPIAGENVPFASYEIDAEKGGSIEYETGSIVKFEPNSFVDQKGKPVKGIVEIKYREFHDPADIYFSGIPMTYDSAGGDWQFESAGMLEIAANQNGEPVHLKKRKEAKVELMSSSSDNDFNLYNLDTNAKNWMYTGKTKIEKLTEQSFESNSIITSLDSEAETTIPSLPVEPILADPEKYKVTLDVSGFPELDCYDNIEFEVHDASFKPSFYKVKWESIELTKGPDEGYYTITASKTETDVKMRVKPVFSGDNIEKAKEMFEKRFKTYQECIDKAELMEDEKRTSKNSIENDAEIKRHRLNMFRRRIAGGSTNGMSEEELETALALTPAIRRFSIRSMGIHNVDRPTLPPRGKSLAIELTDPNGEKFPHGTLFLVDGRINAVFQMASKNRIKYNPRSRNLLWTLTPDMKLAVAVPESFNEVDKKSGKHQFKMIFLENTYASRDGLKRLLKS